jgi:hypothetical protein
MIQALVMITVLIPLHHLMVGVETLEAVDHLETGENQSDKIWQM